MIALNAQDRRWSFIGTLLWHAAIITPLFFIKCDSPGGGGGNNGYGQEGLMSLDIAGFGDTENGFGEMYEEVTAAQFDQPTVDETSAITDDSSTEAPTVNNKPTTQNESPKPNNPTKPNNQQQQQQQQQQVSNGLNNAFGGLKPSGSGSTSGNTQQGNQNGQIGKGGALGGGGSTGTGGGQGGGNGTGNGPGNGPGSGNGDGGMTGLWQLSNRSISRYPTLSETSPGKGVVVVDIWVDAGGNVVKAVANSTHPRTTATSSELYKLAEKAALKAKFSSSDQAQQKGSITIRFE